MTSKAKEFNPSEKIIAIQQEICGLKKDTNNPFFKSKYINLGSIVNALKPVLHKNDCYSTHKVNINEDHRPSLKTEICYKDGTVLLDCTSPLPVKDSSDPQKLGSAITYMRRYNLTALLEIEEDDDDGQKATQEKPIPKPKKITTQQIQEIQELIDKTDKTIQDICGAYKVGSLSDLLDSQFSSIVARLKSMFKKESE